MKKVVLTLCVLFSFVSALALTPERVDFYRQLAQSVSAQCPMMMGQIGNISQVDFNASKAELIYVVSLSDVTASTYRNKTAGDPALKKMLLSSLDLSSVEDFFNLLIGDGVSVSYVMLFPQSSKQLPVIITPADMRRALNTPLSDYERARQWLNISVANENSACPVNIGNNITMNSAKLEGNMVVYRASTDGNTLQVLRSQGSQTKQNMLNSMADPAMAAVVNNYVNAGVGLKYIYSAPGYDPLVVILSLDDLRSIQ